MTNIAIYREAPQTFGGVEPAINRSLNRYVMACWHLSARSGKGKGT